MVSEAPQARSITRAAHHHADGAAPSANSSNALHFVYLVIISVVYMNSIRKAILTTSITTISTTITITNISTTTFTTTTSENIIMSWRYENFPVGHPIFFSSHKIRQTKHSSARQSDKRGVS